MGVRPPNRLEPRRHGPDNDDPRTWSTLSPISASPASTRTRPDPRGGGPQPNAAAGNGAPQPAARHPQPMTAAITPPASCIAIGEHTNLTGAIRCKRLILEGDCDGARQVARQQVEHGAQISDTDAAMPGSQAAMVRCLHPVASAPGIAACRS